MNEEPGQGSLPDHVDPARVVDFDMFNITLVDGEYQLGAARYLRAGIPDIFYTKANGGHWVFTRADDIEHALSVPELFSATKIYVPKEKNPDPPLIPMFADPPDHTKYRALIAPAFSPRAVRQLAEKARALSIALIETFKPRGECEFSSEFSHVLPVAIFMSMVDLPESERLYLQTLSDRHVRPESPEQHKQNFRELHEYALRLLAQRRANPGEDLISVLTRAKVDGAALDDHSLAGMVVLLLLAGTDTVGSTMGFFARFLAMHPEHRQTLRAQPELIPNAVEELMRRYTITTVGRMVTRDYDYRGVTLRQGEMVILPTIFAGLDSEKFIDPLRVDFSRTNIAHAGFGLGQHRCIGAPLARAELRIFMEEWLARIPDFALKPGEPVRVSTGTVSGIRHMSLVWPVA